MSNAEQENLEEQQHWHWRNTMRPAMFFNLDARAALPFVLLLMHARLSTLIFCVVVTVIFMIFEKNGLTVPAAMRSIRVWFLGKERPAWVSYRKRRFVDYG